MHFLAFTIPGLAPISAFFAKVLQFFNTFTGNFGWNVILLTIAFRVVVLPLSFKQTKSMIAMQRLQPQLKEIQKKFKEDREKMGQEMMKLYKENKVSPLGGCLPLILQLPILFALFEVLRSVPKYVHYKTDFSFLGISNLIATGKTLWAGGVVPVQSAKNLAIWVTPKHANFVGHEYLAVIALILITIITGYVSSKMMTNDPKQAKMMAVMPLIFGVFAWILPAGVTLYIIVTNVLMAIQQYIQLEAEGFYDEKRSLRMKTGEPFKWHERWRYKGYDYGSIVLTAVRIKRPPKPEEPKPGAKPAAKKATSGQSKGGQAKPPGGKSSKPPGGKSPTGGTKKLPPKPGTKPPAGKKPAQKPKKRPADTETEEAAEDKTAVDSEPESISEETQNDSSEAAPTRSPAEKAAKAKQYPAKKKSSRKK